MEFICGGYYLTKRGPRGRAFRPQGGFVTISPEQVQFFPDTWAISWARVSDEDRAERAAALDIPGSALPALIPQVTELFDRVFLWPNVIRSVADARQLLQLLPPTPGWLLVAFDVAAQDVEDLLVRNAPAPQIPGFAPTGSGGVFDTLAERKPLEPGFSERGFDVLCIDYGMVFESHLDFDLALTKAYAGPLNADGLLSDYPAAKRAAGVLTNNAAVGTPRTLIAARIVTYEL